MKGAVGKGTFVSEQLPEERQLAKFRPFRNKAEQSKKQVLSSGVATAKLGKLKLGQYTQTLQSSDSRVASHGDGSLASFSLGVPALDEFPAEVWARACATTMERSSSDRSVVRFFCWIRPACVQRSPNTSGRFGA